MLLDGLKVLRTEGRTDKQKDERTEGQAEGRVEGRMVGQKDELGLFVGVVLHAMTCSRFRRKSVHLTRKTKPRPSVRLSVFPYVLLFVLLNVRAVTTVVN